MIQRAQSIYLFLAAITGLLTFFLPFAHYLEGDVKLAEYAVFGVFNVQSDLVEMTGPFLFPTWFTSLFTMMLPATAIFSS